MDVQLLALGVHMQEGYGTCFVCVSVPTLASTSFVSTVQVRYIRLLFRLYSIFNSWIFDKAFRSRLWHEKANILMSISLPQPPMALMQQHFAGFFKDRAFSGFFKV